MTPAEELRKAAATLRELAAEATPGPWDVVNEMEPWDTPAADVANVHGRDRRDGTYDWKWSWVVASPDGHPDPCMKVENARWVAALSPAVAGPLARWLDDAAGESEDYGLVVMAPAYDLARVINEAVIE